MEPFRMYFRNSSPFILLYYQSACNVNLRKSTVNQDFQL